jgi:hypothetical protein
LALSQVKANKPNWEVGTKFSLKRAPPNQPVAAPVKVNPWANAMDEVMLIPSDRNVVTLFTLLISTVVKLRCNLAFYF